MRLLEVERGDTFRSRALIRLISMVSGARLADAAAVAALFNIITRYSDALDFTVPTEPEFHKAAGMLLQRGYE